MKPQYLRILEISFLLFAVLLVPRALAETRTIVTDSHASIGTILELSISQEGQSELRFGNILPSALGETTAGPVMISVEVNSNSGERYQVTQTVNSPLQNAAGDQIGLENLTFTAAGARTSGIGVTEPTAAATAPQTIFTSDSEGSSDTIQVAYLLTVPPTQAPGDYSALLTYTVSSL